MYMKLREKSFKKLMTISSLIIVSSVLLGISINNSYSSVGSNSNNYFHWGFETNTCNLQALGIRIGTGLQPVNITSIDGSLSISPMPGSDTTNSNLKQVLVVFQTSTSNNSTDLNVITQPKGTTNELDRNIFSYNLKQMGITPVNLPVHIVYNPPLYLYNGYISAVIVPLTTNSLGQNVTVSPNCPDVEGQLIAQYNIVK